MDELKDQKDDVKGDEITSNEKTGAVSFIERLTTVLMNPVKGMALAAKSPMIIGLLIILAISALVIFLPQRPMFLKSTMEAIENSGQTFSPDEIDNIISQSVNAAMFSSMFYFIFAPILKSAVVFAVAIILNGKGKMKTTLGVVVNAYLIMIVGQALRMVVVLITKDPYFSFSPALFLPEGSQTTGLFAVLSAFDIFALWYLAVSMIGVGQVHGLSRVKASIAVFGPWLLLIVFGAAGMA